MITQDILKSKLSYDSLTGIFLWISGKRKGMKAGCEYKAKYNYIVIRIDDKLYQAHRLAVLYMTGENPKHLVDHKDGICNNNIWKNIRVATRSQNNQNRIKCKHGKSLYKGVHYEKETGKYKAQIMVNGKKKNLGRFTSVVEAGKAYQDAALAVQKEFNHAFSKNMEFTLKEPAAVKGK